MKKLLIALSSILLVGIVLAFLSVKFIDFEEIISNSDKLNNSFLVANRVFKIDSMDTYINEKEKDLTPIKTYTLADNLNTINANVNDASFTLYSGEEVTQNTLYVIGESDINLMQEDGTLTIESSEYYDDEEIEIIIALPNTVHLDILNINSKNHSTYLDNVTVDNISLTSKNGSVIINQSTIDDLSVYSQNGVVKILDSSVRYIDSETTNGSQTYSNVTTENITSKNLNSYTKFEGNILQNSYFETVSGKLYLEGYFENGLNAKTSNGSIQCDFKLPLDTYSINATTNNGYIKVDGNKYISSYTTDNGDNVINLSTDNGYIKLDDE